MGFENTHMFGTPPPLDREFPSGFTQDDLKLVQKLRQDRLSGADESATRQTLIGNLELTIGAGTLIPASMYLMKHHPNFALGFGAVSALALSDAAYRYMFATKDSSCLYGDAFQWLKNTL